MSKQDHWDMLFRTKIPTNVSWFQPHLDSSLQLIDSIDLDRDAGIIDIGCGTSTFVCDLVKRGFTNVTCMDISPEAVRITTERLGERKSEVC